MKRLPLLSLLILFCACRGAGAADFKVLVLGNSQSLNAASEAAFPPSGVASHLREILAADPALAGVSITVTANDFYQSKSYTQTFTQTLSCRTLMSGYYWPPTRAATTALLAQGWDYVVMIEDPYTASRFPEYSFEGVRAIAREVRQAGGQPLLVMTWSSAATTTAKFAEMTCRVGDATGVPVVPAGHAWSGLAAGLKGTGTRPNLQGSYLTAAAIYSRITSRDSASSAYVPATLALADRDALAATALAAVQAAAGQTHYTGNYTGPTHFAAPLLKKRTFTYTDFNSSTEWGYRGGLAAVLSLARMNWTQTYSGYQSLPQSGYIYDFAQTRDYSDADPSRWKIFGTFDYQDDSGGESMISGVDRVMYAAPLPEQETSAANITASRIADGTFFVPVRVLWSRLTIAQPAIAAQPDGHHLSDAYNQGVASMMFTLLTGRCGVGSEPGNVASTDWQNWYCRKTGYEIAWQYATLQERVPGLEVLPASANATLVTPGATTTLTVRFLYPPTSSVAVNVSIDSATAATVPPATLTFTPQNYNIAQTVTVTALAGASAFENFNVSFTTASSDAIFNGLSDSWAYATARPANGVWAANASGTWTDTTKWSGGNPANGTGSADFSSIDITADRTVSLDAPLSVGGLAFGDTAAATAGGWTLDNNGNSANTLTLLGTSPVITVNALGTGKAATVSAILAGSAGMVKSGPGTLNLSGLNTYAGGTTVSAGTLRLATGGGIGAIRGSLTVNSGAAVISSAASSFGYNSGTKIDSLTLNNGTLTHTPAGGTLTLASVPISLTGGTMDSSGTAGFDFYDLAGNTGVTTFASTNTSTIAGIVNLRAGDGDSAGTVFTVADGAAASDLLVSADLVNGQYQGAASVVQKSGAGRMVLSGNNNYSGGTILNAGTLVASSNTAFGANSTVTLGAASGGVLELATADGALTRLYGLNMGSNRFNTLIVNRATPGTANYVFGSFSLGSSTMTFNKGANIAGNGSVSVGTLDLSAENNDRPATLSGGASIQVASAAIISNNSISKRLQLDGTAANNTIGPVSNGGGAGILSLIKAGPGTWTLTGNNTYTGGTSVSGGTLKLDFPCLDDASTVRIDGVLHLAHAGIDVVGALYLGGILQPAGTYNQSNSGGFITGTGSLRVGSGSAFGDWAQTRITALQPSADVTPNGDPDGDGVTNLAEFAFRGNPLDGAENGIVRHTAPGALVLTVAIRKGSSAAFSGSPLRLAVAGVTYTIEGSTDLADFTAGVTEISPSVNGLPDLPADADYEYRGFSLGGSGGLTGKGFLRAKVEQ